jgi:hypothetical protein
MVPETVTQLLADWDAGDQEALQRLMPIVYDELHRLAKGYLQRQPLVAGSVTSRTTLSSAARPAEPAGGAVDSSCKRSTEVVLVFWTRKGAFLR